MLPVFRPCHSLYVKNYFHLIVTSTRKITGSVFYFYSKVSKIVHLQITQSDTMKKTILCASLLAASCTANSEELSLGVITSYSPAVYKGADSNIVPFPMLGYEGKHIYLRGTEAGIRILPAGAPTNIIFRLAYDPRILKPEDSDDLDIKKLDERKAGALAGVTFEGNNQYGVFQASLGTAVSSDKTGVYAEVVYKKPFNMGLYGFTPEIGYAFNSDKLNNRLYGVSAEEAARTRFDEFDASWSGQIFVGIGGYAYLIRNIRLIASLRYTKLDSDLANSPIIDDDTAVSGTLGATYVF